MRFYGKAECAAKQIVAAFQAGNLPQALAPIFVHRRDSVPMASWSWHNQLLCVLAGCADARGYRQWEEAGRHVRKGQHARAQILVPCTRSETVAELGAAVLLECLGHALEADRGGCWSYVSAYARDAGLEPIAACNRVLKRTCDAVALILDTAEQLAASQAVVDSFTDEAQAVA